MQYSVYWVPQRPSSAGTPNCLAPVLTIGVLFADISNAKTYLKTLIISSFVKTILKTGFAQRYI